MSKVAEQLGVQLRRASPAFVREHTDQPIGGVAPVGHPKPIPTIVDRALAEFDELWAAGGIPHAVFPLTYGELIRLTGGVEADVNEDDNVDPEPPGCSAAGRHEACSLRMVRTS